MKTKLTLISLVAAMGVVGLSGCFGPRGGDTSSSSSSTSGSSSSSSSSSSSDTSGSEVQYSFSLALGTGRKTVEVGDDNDNIEILVEGSPENTPDYEYSSNDEDVAEVDFRGNITFKAVGTASFTVVDNANGKYATLTGINVIAKAPKASGGFNYSSAAGSEAIETRTEILGALEKYAMESHLTGITLFENGGYVKYSPRVSLPTTNYITGYGFGLLSEGSLTGPLDSEENPAHKMYLHSATSSDPLTINEMNDTGSQVSDLASYITSSFWGTKMNSTKTGYDWYPVLARDDRPTPNEATNPLGLYKKWRIFVKTGDSTTPSDERIYYRTNSSLRSAFDNRPVALADYEFKFMALLTGANRMIRGGEMANDQTYGIKGAKQFYERTKDMTDQTLIEKTWSDMKNDGLLGFSSGVTGGRSYIDLEILNPIDSFTAMYTFSSSLYSPLPKEFITAIGDGSVIEGMKRYGRFNNGGDNAILDYTLCLGAFSLEAWQKRGATVYKRNDNWFEYPSRYKIAGIKLRVIEAAAQDPEAIYKEFNSGNLDSCGIPTSKIAEEKNQERVYPTKGDSTFKLNVNSCDQSTWDDLFGPTGKISPGSTWTLKPWMANDDFLNGLFYSINRKEFAEKRGVQPSINYFSDSYLSDPEHGISYNSTQAHKDAVDAFQVEADGEDMYGYSKTKAIACFKRAYNSLKKVGDIHDGDTIRIHIRWMYQSDIKEYGDDIIRYFTTAFNDPQVSGNKVTLAVDQEAVTQWDQVYNEYLMKGQFDLGFGAISGNTYNPLNFLEVLKSDNSSGFTLNWGTDTSKVDEDHALIYDGKRWSFDALWNVSDHGGVVDDGKIIKSVKHAYFESPRKQSDNTTTDDLTVAGGVTVKLPIEFVSASGVEFAIANEGAVQLYIVGSGNHNLNYTKSSDGKYITITISQAEALEIRDEIRTANKLTDTDPTPIANPFTRTYYGVYWTFEVYYTISINGGSPTQNYVTAAKSKAEWDSLNS